MKPEGNKRTGQSARKVVTRARPLSWSEKTAALWRTEPLALPQIDPQLLALSALERVAEVLRFSVLRAEFWIAPGGTLRAMLRICLGALVFLAIPALTLGPAVLLLLGEAEQAAALLAALAASLAAAMGSFCMAILGFALLRALWRTLCQRRQSGLPGQF